MIKKEIAFSPERIQLLRHLVRYHKLDIMVFRGEKISSLECVKIVFLPHDALLVDWLIEKIESYNEEQED